jgi:hypothetical protein
LDLRILHIVSSGGTNLVDIFLRTPQGNRVLKQETLSLSDRDIAAILPDIVNTVKQDKFKHLYGNGGYPQSCIRDHEILEANFALLSAVAGRAPAQQPRP